MKRKLLFVLVLILLGTNSALGQNAPEIIIPFNETFFNNFLDAVFNNLETPKFQLAKKQKRNNPADYQRARAAGSEQTCEESITLLREANGVKTAIRIAENKVVAPVAFSGTYDVPFVGCSNFRGVADANLNLEYNREQKILYGRVKVTKVDLNGIPGIAGGVVAKLVQASIDSRVNPIKILEAEQASATVPIAYANGSIKVRAVDMTPEVAGSLLNVRVAFEFTKAQ